MYTFALASARFSAALPSGVYTSYASTEYGFGTTA